MNIITTKLAVPINYTDGGETHYTTSVFAGTNLRYSMLHESEKEMLDWAQGFAAGVRVMNGSIENHSIVDDEGKEICI